MLSSPALLESQEGKGVEHDLYCSTKRNEKSSWFTVIIQAGKMQKVKQMCCDRRGQGKYQYQIL